MKVDNLRAQISSLNDELKDTNRLVELKHSERDLLLKEIGELKLNRKEAESLYLEEKDRLASIRFPEEQTIANLKIQIESLENEVNKQQSIVDGLTQKESGLRDKIKDLKDDKKKLLVIRAELEETKNTLNLLEPVKKELLENLDKIKEAKAELDIVTRESERTKQDIKESRLESVEWEAGMRTKIDLENKGSVLLRLDWEKKLRDLKVVEKRLKKIWEQTSKLPFPKIYDAPGSRRN